MQIRNFNSFTFDDCIVVAYFFTAIVSSFTRDDYKLCFLIGKRMHITALFFLGADKWPEMEKKTVVLN